MIVSTSSSTVEGKSSLLSTGGKRDGKGVEVAMGGFGVVMMAEVMYIALHDQESGRKFPFINIISSLMSVKMPLLVHRFLVERNRSGMPHIEPPTPHLLKKGLE
ncbi:hypothetical protein Tco_1451143, partial [Tanacetum coccineum]